MKVGKSNAKPWIPLVAGLAVAGNGGLALADQDDEERDDTIEHQAIVELVPGSDINELNTHFFTQTIASIPDQGLYLLGLPLQMDPEEFRDLLMLDERVLDTEVNDDATSPTSVGGDTQPFFFQVVPSAYDDQYTPGLLDLGAAHALSRGAGAIVAIVDTGVDATHFELAGRVLPNGYNFVSNNTDVSDVGNGYDEDGDGIIDEMVGHGTLVAGIVALVAPEASILPIKALDSDGNSHVFRLTQAIYYAVDQGADVINMSLSTRSHNHILRDAVEYARSQGVILVAAVGNDDREHPTPMPAGEDEVLGVVATDAADLKASYSNYGTYAALSAPGDGLVSTVPGDAYGLASGTSLASAIVSGVAALLMASDLQATADDVTASLMASAVDVDDLNPDYAGKLGAGRIDAGAAVGAFVGDPGDLDQDGRVDPDDLVILVSAWGYEGPLNDLDNDGTVGFGDVLVLVDAWE